MTLLVVLCVKTCGLVQYRRVSWVQYRDESIEMG